MKKVNEFMKMNEKNLERRQMQQVFGGGQNGGSVNTGNTDTVDGQGTVTNDGDDSWEGESDGTIPPAG